MTTRRRRVYPFKPHALTDPVMVRLVKAVKALDKVDGYLLHQHAVLLASRILDHSIMTSDYNVISWERDGE